MPKYRITTKDGRYRVEKRHINFCSANEDYWWDVVRISNEFGYHEAIHNTLSEAKAEKARLEHEAEPWVAVEE